MSVEAAMRGSVCLLMLGTCALPCAAEETESEPDPAFIEYLGMWEESDEDWQMLEGKVAENLEENDDALSPDEDPVEYEDES
jgi:hypothetical protein